jgi:hypothetical protein
MADRLRTRPATIVLAALLALLCLACLGARTASALEIRAFLAEPTSTQAGGHPNLVIKYSGESRDNPQRYENCQCNDPENVDMELPTGFIGNPHSTPQCDAADFAIDRCPIDSQVGVAGVRVDIGGGIVFDLAGEPVYNAVPKPGQAGLLSTKLLQEFFDIPLFTVLEARTGTDYGLNANTDGIERQFPIQGFEYELWGVPADSANNARRGNEHYGYNHASNSPHVPFLQNPDTCANSYTTKVTVKGYDDSVNSETASWPQATGCDQLSFNPSLTARPTTTDADSASGVDVDLTVPQLLSPTFPSPSELRAATVTLPEGFSFNPNAADGKTSCSNAEAKFGTQEAAECPEFAKVGTDSIDSSALPGPIPGGIYIGEPLPGNRYRILLTGSGFGTNVKIAGRISPDPVTGQIVAIFENLPQSPLTEFNMHFFGAERGILATPTKCGTYPVESTFVPWDEALSSQSSTQFFTIDSGPGGSACPSSPRPFGPAFSAASAKNGAGLHSSFGLTITRGDGEQNLAALQVKTPPGFSAKLAGVAYCSDAALASAADPLRSGTTELTSPACPSASQIGTSVVGAGAGSHPVFLPGKVYLAGPYKGAPLSLAVVTPAVSGPYDLGSVVVRSAIHVDPITAQVSVDSDPLPQILEGIPLRLRQIQVELNRPEFALNPTNCEPFGVEATLSGTEGGVAKRSSPFQVANCANLPYGPKLTLQLKGSMTRTGNPALTATLRAKPGEANTKLVVVTTPHSLFLDNSHIGTPCTRVQYAALQCPPGSVIGSAKAFSPLIEKPLEGPVYLRSSSHKLPDIVADLKGQFEIELPGRISSVNERLRASFETPPDVPIDRFTLSMLGGKKGLLVNSAPLCAKPQRVGLLMGSQSGKRIKSNPQLELSCGSKKRRARR